MGIAAFRVSLAGVLCGALAVACSTAPDPAAEDDAEVLGIQVERTDGEVATVVPTEAPVAPSASASPSPTEAPTEERTEEPAGERASSSSGDADAPATRDAVPPDDGADTDGPAATTAPAAPSPAPRAPASPSPSPAPAPAELTTREGHSFLAWFRDEEPTDDGGTRYVWGEVSAAPTVTREGSEPLRVTLIDLAGDPDRSAPRRAQCQAWLEVDGDRSVRAQGEVTVEVVVDGAVASDGTRSVDVTVAPGERRDLVAIGDVRVAVPDVAEVTCRVRFVDGASG